MDKFRHAVSKSYAGPGGAKCPCCNCLFGKSRRKLNQIARKRLKTELQKEMKYRDG